MSYPVGPLLRTLANRILNNLDHIDQQAPKWGSSNQNEPPYTDTQLIISLLGVLVFPNERTPNALGELLKGYEHLSQVVKVRYPKEGATSIEIFGAGDRREIIDPNKISSLPQLLRNSIAHFNVLPVREDGRFAGIRIWNEDLEGRITFVADLDFDKLRPLARHILQALTAAELDVELVDPEDPLETLNNLKLAALKRQKPPRVIDTVWEELVGAHEGDYHQAKRSVDQILAREAKRLRLDRMRAEGQ